jgi:hypothetical protein
MAAINPSDRLRTFGLRAEGFFVDCCEQGSGGCSAK